ncbi:hypothetical protein MHU86_20010 [Fragilaria crotonensis]|nr:hypothetical protein MHU86_20010 [Fragilaria crotonensis]
MDDVRKGSDERNVAETAADATGVGRRSGPVSGRISASGSGSVQGVPNKRRDSISLKTNAGIQHPAAMSAVDSGPSCLICTKSHADIKYSRGHALCTICVLDKLGDDNGFQLLCLIKECPSKLQDNDFYGRIPVDAFRRYVEKRAERNAFDERNIRMESKIDRLLLRGQNHQEHFQRLARGLNRSLTALALL